MSLVAVGQRFTIPEIVDKLYPSETYWGRNGQVSRTHNALARDRGMHFIKVYQSPGKTTVWERIA